MKDLQPQEKPKPTKTMAAVDLGSNSFHMIVADVSNDTLHIVDKMKEMVRLAAGLDEDNRISADVRERALACLERFGQRLRDLPPGSVRAVGTNTLRKARNGDKFIRQAEQRLGHPIDIISGPEEARLIYLGVSHSLEDDGERRLVMDIGGGSTEFIIGQHFRQQQVESLFMGCVSMSQRFFNDGRIDAKRMQKAIIAAHQELSNIQPNYSRIGWDSAIGASGSILSIRTVVQAQGWSEDGISRASLDKLRQHLESVGHIDELNLDGLSDERRPVFAGGVAILYATFEAFGLELMRVSSGALREGLLYELLGRIHQEDVRERTTEQLMQRYGVDTEQAGRVERTALALLEQTPSDWQQGSFDVAALLSRAARLHEMGLAIAHSQYHKHSAYLATHLHMPGFARGEQRMLACLLRGHRRKFPRDMVAELPKAQARIIRRLCLILRLAVLLNRSRSAQELPSVELTVGKKKLKLGFPSKWLEQHPLTRADLEQEAASIESINYQLNFE